MELQSENIVDSACLLGESPVWDAANKRLMWLDILKSELHQFYPAVQEHTTVKMSKVPGCIALSAKGDLLAAVEDGFAFVNPVNGKLEMIAEIEKENTDNRFNDGKFDPAGRFWAGSMSMSGKPRAGNVYALESNGSVSLKIEGVSCSNGMAWSRDGSKFYYIDTPTRQVVSYDFGSETGNISNKRVVINFSAGDGLPDGMTIDSNGMLWIALWDGWKVVRIDPGTGLILENIPLPVSRVTSCAFGGDNLQDLYITSARTGLTDSELARQPLAGALFLVKNTGFHGFNNYNI